MTIAPWMPGNTYKQPERSKASIKAADRMKEIFELSRSSGEMVQVPKWALAKVMDNGIPNDAGPDHEGWYSDELKDAIEALAAALD